MHTSCSSGSVLHQSVVDRYQLRGPHRSPCLRSTPLPRRSPPAAPPPPLGFPIASAPARLPHPSPTPVSPPPPTCAALSLSSRLSISICFSPAPLTCPPPPTRSRCVHMRVRRGSWYSVCASSTWGAGKGGGGAGRVDLTDDVSSRCYVASSLSQDCPWTSSIQEGLGMGRRQMGWRQNESGSACRTRGPGCGGGRTQIRCEEVTRSLPDAALDLPVPTGHPKASHACTTPPQVHPSRLHLPPPPPPCIAAPPGWSGWLALEAPLW